MALWTDVIDPAELTGYARASLEELEARKDSLGAFLPNENVIGTSARLMQTVAGYAPEASWRAYDAEPTIGRMPGGQRVTIDLAPIGHNIPISEFDQLTLRRASDEQMRNAILRATRTAVQAVANTVVLARGSLLATGKLTINQPDFQVDLDMGRGASMSTTVSTLWSATGADPLDDLLAAAEAYETLNGVAPGTILMGRTAFSLLQRSDTVKTVLVGGAERLATAAEVNALTASYGLPAVTVYTRKVGAKFVVPENTVLLLPPEGEPLGATLWGETLTGTDPRYNIADTDLPGLVVGAFRGEKPPMIAEVIADGIAAPVLANANLAMAVKVLA